MKVHILMGYDAYVSGDALMLHYYPHLGIISEDHYGIWEALCGCSGYIDENYDAVISRHCQKHAKLKRRVKHNYRAQEQKLGKTTKYTSVKEWEQKKQRTSGGKGAGQSASCYRISPPQPRPLGIIGRKGGVNDG